MAKPTTFGKKENEKKKQAPEDRQNKTGRKRENNPVKRPVSMT